MVTLEVEVTDLVRAWVKTTFVSALAVALSACVVSVAGAYVYEPGTHEIEIHGQHFEVETEVTIELVFSFVDEVRATGTVTVLDPPGSGLVSLLWLEQSAYIIDEIIEGTVEFDYESSETGHAERGKVPKFGPTMPCEPKLD
jgi:hypothetical protein